MRFQELNRLQMPTWSWLRVNGADLEVAAQGDWGGQPGITGAGDFILRSEVVHGPIPHLPPDLVQTRSFIEEHHNCALTIEIPGGLTVAEPIVVEFLLDDANQYLSDYIHIRAGAGSRATLAVCYRSDSLSPCFHSGFTYLEVELGANVQLIKSQMLGDSDVHIDMVAALLKENAHGDLLLCELGSRQSVAGCNVLLEGDGSGANISSLYIGEKQKRMDLSYRLEYRGKGTAGDIIVKGALAGQAHKTLKSTIDFIAGACGAKGREEESVLVLGDGVVNISSPLLLCGEDDVEGEHATSTGKPDPAKLFYLMSRGLSEREAKQLLLEAAFTPILNQIRPDELREDVTARIQEVTHSGE